MSSQVERRSWRSGGIALCMASCLIPTSGIAHADDALEALLARMNAAVLAADMNGYLACVDTRDPVFAREQKNWAADLKRKPVKEFAIQLQDQTLVSPDGPMNAQLSMNWTLADQDAPKRTISFPATFTRDAAGGWLYAGETWQTIESNGVKVLYDQGLDEVAKSVVEILPDIRAHVNEGFEVAIDRVQEVKLYASMRHLQQSIYLSYTDSLGGWNEPGESIKILVGRKSKPAELKPLLAHEYGHVATFEYGPHASDMPWWVLEGVAELSAEAYGGARDVSRMVARWASNGKLADWDRLADFHTVKAEDQMYVYSQGHHMLGFVSEKFGRTGRNAWLRAMAQGATLDEATRAAMKMPFTELDSAWRASFNVQRPETPTQPTETPGTQTDPANHDGN